MAHLLLLNGPNLNLLGSREPDKYGTATLPELTAKLEAQASQRGQRLSSYQSNSEAELIDHIHQASQEQVDFILFNPGAFTHTSIALRDALLAVKIPFIEIHLSNVHAREAFRRHSYFSDVAAGVIVGFGPLGYELALQAAIERLSR